jgi:hypothetical protein
MKNALTTWKWSLRVIARSPLVLLALSALVAAEFYGAYRWLYFPMESAIYLMLIGFLWAVLECFIVVAFLTVTAGAVQDAVESGADSLTVHQLIRLRRTEWLRTAAFVAFASALMGGIHYLFWWLEGYSLEVASFLTFRSEKPVAPDTIDGVFEWIENVLLLVVAGFLIAFLLTLIRHGWREAVRAAPRLLANACWRVHFLTGLVSVLVFGGLAYLLVTWHLAAPSGFLDFSQVIFRNGLALILAVGGWLFWLLSIARLSFPDSGSVDPSTGT